MLKWLLKKGKMKSEKQYYWILFSWFIQLSVQTFKPLIVMYRRGNFVYHHRGCDCASIYWPLSCTFRSLCWNVGVKTHQNKLLYSKQNPGKEEILDCKIQWYPKLCNKHTFFVKKLWVLLFDFYLFVPNYWYLSSIILSLRICEQNQLKYYGLMLKKQEWQHP